MWQARMRDYILGLQGPICFVKEDEDSEEAASIVIWQIRTRSPKVTMVTFMPWQPSADFSEQKKRWVAVGPIAWGGAFLRNVVGRHTDATQFIELHTIML